MSWDNFNESGDLKAQVEAYHRFTGYYPEPVYADRSDLPYKGKPSMV